MPTRYLKAGIRDSELIDSLSPLAETFYYRLLVTVDDFGRFDARPAMIKAQCFPIKESVTVKNCSDMLKELANSGLIDIYEVDGKSVLQVCKWDNVPRAKESKYADKPTDASIPHTTVCNTNTNAPLTVTKTKTETETETKTPASPKPVFVLPEWIPKESWDGYVEMRKRIKKPMTDRAVDLKIKDLEMFKSQGHNIASILDKSASNNWTDLYAPKPEKQSAFTLPSPAITTPSRETVDPLMSRAIQESTRTFKPVAEIHARLKREQKEYA